MANFLRRHGKSTPTIGKTAMFLVVDVVIMTSHVAGSAVDRFWTDCHVDAMAVVKQNHMDKKIKN